MAKNNSQGEQTRKEKAVYKIFNDSVHGHIEMHPLLVKIIDTPAFQRLRNIKQFGGGYLVFPGVSHNRFEHCIGVAHLAGKLVQNLRDCQPALGINDTDKLCVQIAGLCHDLGHGPFSHAFDAFMEMSRGLHGDVHSVPTEWKHEAQSVKMFDHLIEGDIKRIMEEDYGFENNDFDLIKELINSPQKEGDEWPYKGRKKEKSFLYEIVANHVTGIDVDKMDYLSRDCHHLGMTSNFSHERYMMFARVCKVQGGKTQICMRDKEAMNMYELFHLRNLLHQRACHHRVTKAVELMITDALIAADEHLTLGQKKLTITQAVDDCETFTCLTDDILQKILRSSNNELSESQEIIKSILERNLYHFIDEEIFQLNPNKLGLDTAEKRETLLEDWLAQQPKYMKHDLTLVCIDLNYGMKNKDPVSDLQFYRKDQPDTPHKRAKDEVSLMLPEKFAETRVMLFYKRLLLKQVKNLWENLQNHPKQ
ncbi:deoxynucleoside triphosphate triphosphohydrolase SAMHD1-like [Salminus brasiliensis]|uniref:deoxynucleoside triphosphate triphosphohydrolase SAMHD1-like n=1 Tax=Salminus brasiliensis TaxID=930266 RepID=UPI003B832F2F